MKKVLSLINRFVALIPIGLIRLYQIFLSPFLGRNCRFTPTCSQYGLDAYKKYNVFKATWLTIYRILRCNPWGGSGYDPA